mgnify:CR=1 FL=1
MMYFEGKNGALEGKRNKKEIGVCPIDENQPRQ